MSLRHNVFVRWITALPRKTKGGQFLSQYLDNMRIVIFKYWMRVEYLSSTAVAAVDRDVVDVAGD
jgi:hypothetical protein